MDLLPTVWFIIIAFLWFGFLLLEGFDFGVGMLMKVFARDEKERRLMLNSIGPVWDGNEVWLITAIGAMFGAFPLWYASLLSSLYIPATVLLLALIFRAVSIEWRGKGASDRWRAGWTSATAIGSLVAAFCVGVMLSLTTTGIPIDARGNNVGGPFVWVSVEALVGGLAVVAFSLLQGLVFLTLKTDGPVRQRSRVAAARLAPLLLLPMVGWILLVLLGEADALEWTVAALAVASGVLAWFLIRAGRERAAFLGTGGFLLLSLVAIFGTAFPTLIPSTLSSDFDLTAADAASAPYTLVILLVVGVVFVPLVIAYQAWSYRVFSPRLRVEHIPEAHTIAPAIRGR